MPAPVYAQWGTAEPQWAQPSTPPPVETLTPALVRSEPTTAICSKPTILKGQDGIVRTLCSGKYANGILTMTAPSKDGHTYTYSGQFKAGVMVGNIRFNDETNSFNYLGTMNSHVRANGTTAYIDGTSEYGTYRGNKLHNGVIEKPGPFNQTIKLQIENGIQFGPTENMQIAAIEERFRPKHMVSMTKVKLGGPKTCLADLPSKLFKIKPNEMSGRCKDGYYSGKAKIELIPLSGNPLPPMNVTLRYEAGQIVGPVTAKYTTLDETFRGDMSNWLPQTGESEKHIGNRNYQITEWQDTQPITSRVVNRPPSEAEQIFIRTISHVAERAVDCFIVGACKDQRQAEKRAYRADQARKDDLAAQNQQFETARQQNQARAAEEQAGWARVAAQQETDRRNSQAAIIEGMRRNGLDPNGNPLPAPPVRVASNDPPPNTAPSPPPFEVITEPPVFEVSTRPQGPPPEFAPPIPAPVFGSNDNSLPRPVPEPILPSTFALPQPIVGSSPQPVALPAPDGGILGSGGQEPSPSAAPPNPPSSQPVAVYVPNIPTGLYPTNPDELAQPIPLGWTSVQGAIRYRITVKDHVTGDFPVNDAYTTANPFTVRNLPAGRNYSWDVAACNAAGCSGRSRNGSFRTGNGSTNLLVQCDARLTRNQEAIIRDYIEATGQPRPRDSAICNWKQQGSLLSNLQSLSNQAVEARRNGRQFWEIPVSERHWAGLRAISSSPEVRAEISKLYEEIAMEVAIGDLRRKLPPPADFGIDVVDFLNDAAKLYLKNKTERRLMEAASTINLMASFTSDQISKRIGLPIGPSKLLNLAGAATGVYINNFFNPN